MSYIGNIPTTAAFPFDQFSGNASTTAFILTYAPAGSTSILVSVSGVTQNPNTYSCVGTTLTFTGAPPTGTNNIAVLYLGMPVIGVTSPGNTAYRTPQDFTATASQTTFNTASAYTVGFVDVYRNGARLGTADFTATNTTTVVLANACTAGDLVTIVYFTLTSIVNAVPQSGGTITGSLVVNGTTTMNGAAGSGYTGMKNRIINGNMAIDQRNSGAAITPADTAYGLDRWSFRLSQASKFTTQQNAGAVTPPIGFTKYLGVTSSSAYTVGAADFFTALQYVEGYNLADLAWGTASAAAVTLSFWVQSSLTGTFGGSFNNTNNTRSYPFTFSISVANTWEYKTVTIAGDTTGTWDVTTGRGLGVRFNLGAGSTYSGTANVWSGNTYFAPTGAVSVVGTSGATFYVTGVQLERGSNATSFEFIDYGRQLIQCQRYYYRRNYDQSTTDVVATFQAYSTGGSWGKVIDLPVEMRATPTGSLSAIGHFRPTNSSGSAQAAFTAGSLAGQGTTKAQLTTAGWSGSSGIAAGNATVILNNTTSAWIDASAEL